MRILAVTLVVFSVAAAAAAGSDKAVSDCGTGRVKPATIVLFCGDAGQYLTKLRWSRWGGRTAVARGTFNEKTCDPFCAAGGVRQEYATVHLFDARRCPGRSYRYYRRATIFLASGNEHARFACPYSR
jgi:hypothetical protein